MTRRELVGSERRQGWKSLQPLRILLPLVVILMLAAQTPVHHYATRSSSIMQQQQQQQYEHNLQGPPPPHLSTIDQNHNEYYLLPSCEELMQRPNSPYADGAFLTRRSTHVHWRIRTDHSRELVLPNTCILKRYTSTEAKTCLRDKHVMFVGDSLSRYQYLSLVYFLEYDRWPKRFNSRMSSSFCVSGASGGTTTTLEKNTRNYDIADETACSTRSEPNVCSEGDWDGGWPAYQQSLGGGEDGGIFRGRMESHSTRGCKTEGENMQYVTAADPILFTNSGGGSSSSSELNNIDNSINDNNRNWKGRTKVSFTMEFGWDDVGIFSPGWNYTGCAHDGTCRYTQQHYENNMNLCEEGNNLDWQYPSIIEAFGGNSDSSVDNNSNNENNKNVTKSQTMTTKTVFREQYADVNYVFYNRGLWGKIPEEKARKMMSLLHDFTTPWGGDWGGDNDSNNPKNRCFFKSTTGCGRSHSEHYDYEFRIVRPTAFLAGCEYMDVGHLTREFASFQYSHPQPPRDVMSEYSTIFWDAVHYQPWVYEELNTVLLNVLCNAAG